MRVTNLICTEGCEFAPEIPVNIGTSDGGAPTIVIDLDVDEVYMSDRYDGALVFHGSLEDMLEDALSIKHVSEPEGNKRLSELLAKYAILFDV